MSARITGALSLLVFPGLAAFAGCFAVSGDDLPSSGCVEQSTFFPDKDGDGYGDAEGATEACEAPVDYVTVGRDCDDGDREVNPGAPELCDEVDHNCSGGPGDTPASYYPDADGDGFGGKGHAAVEACEPSDGWVADQSDCDDADPAIHPMLVDQATGVLEADGTGASPFSSIQQALDSAQSTCPLVLVRPGTYREAVVLQARSGLTLRATGTAAATVLESSGGERPLSLLDVDDVTVAGLSLTAEDPVEGSGGGLLVDSSSGVRLEELVVSRCVASGDSSEGGGIAVRASDSVTLLSSSLLSNTATYGGGVACVSSTLTVSACDFEANQSSEGGGGAYVGNPVDAYLTGTLTVEASTFLKNVATSSGGGILAQEGHALYVYDSLFQENRAKSYLGGAVYNPTEVDRSIFIQNQATGSNILSDGGAICLRQSATVTNSVMMGNKGEYGGAIEVYEFDGDVSSHQVVNNTFVDNVATWNGSAINIYRADYVTIRNNIVAGFGSSNNDTYALYNYASNLSWVFDHNDVYVESGYGVGGDAQFGDNMSEDGNLAAQPQFASYAQNDFGTADLHLQETSPCIDVGNALVGNDPDGSPPDLGAYGGPGAL